MFVINCFFLLPPEVSFADRLEQLKLLRYSKLFSNIHILLFTAKFFRRFFKSDNYTHTHTHTQHGRERVRKMKIQLNRPKYKKENKFCFPDRQKYHMPKLAYSIQRRSLSGFLSEKTILSKLYQKV